MPIAVRVVSAEAYAAWMAAFQAGSVADANATLPPLSAAPAA
jgi:cytochrome c oxidase subunit 2